MRDNKVKKCLLDNTCGNNLCCSLCNNDTCWARCNDNCNECSYALTENNVIINRKKPKLELCALSYLKENNITKCMLEETICHKDICCKFCSELKSCTHPCTIYPINCRYVTK